MYFSQGFSPKKVNNISCLKECFKFELECVWETVYITLIYHSSGQSSEEFDTFLSNFELLRDYIANCNPFVSIIIGDFSDKTISEGTIKM